MSIVHELSLWTAPLKWVRYKLGLWAEWVRSNSTTPIIENRKTYVFEKTGFSGNSTLKINDDSDFNCIHPWHVHRLVWTVAAYVLAHEYDNFVS